MGFWAWWCMKQAPKRIAVIDSVQQAPTGQPHVYWQFYTPCPECKGPCLGHRMSQ